MDSNGGTSYAHIYLRSIMNHLPNLIRNIQKHHTLTVNFTTLPRFNKYTFPECFTGNGSRPRRIRITSALATTLSFKTQIPYLSALKSENITNYRVFARSHRRTLLSDTILPDRYSGRKIHPILSFYRHIILPILSKSGSDQRWFCALYKHMTKNLKSPLKSENNWYIFWWKSVSLEI